MTSANRPGWRWAAGGVALAALAAGVRGVGPTAIELRATRSLQNLGLQFDGPMRTISIAGGIPALAGAIAITGIALFRMRRVRESAALMTSLLSAEAATLVLRLLTDRPRPAPNLVRVVESGPGTSFPSGHAADAAALAVLIVMLVPARHRRVAAVSMTLFALLGGVSRVYLGAHWPTDVVGGYLLGAGVGAAVGYVAQREGS